MKRLLSLLCLVVVAAVLANPCLADRKRGPFTEPPRSVRSRDFDQQHLRLELAFDWDRHEMTGRAIHTLTPFQKQSSVQLDAVDMTIKGVSLLADGNESPLKFTHQKGSLKIGLDRARDAGESFQVAIDYLVRQPKQGVHFVLPDEEDPHQPQMVWTQSEPEYARNWHPCLDSPSDRLTSEVVATVPQEFFVLSNGVLEHKQANEDGTATWHWRQKLSHVPYLISVVAGEFDVYEQQWQGVPITSYVPKGRLGDAARSFEDTPAMMKLFTEKIGVLYPWPKYAQICVDEYNWGGMEHTSATTLNVSTLHDERAHLDVSSDNLVAHELAHQWFGNLLTCKDWGELWLNESFATYLATLWTEHEKGWEEAVWERHEEANSYLNEDKNRYRRPIVTYRYKSPGAMFDRHSYPKGARVLHVLRHELGDEQFWRAVHRYTTVNRFRTVETANLRIAIEDATGRGMNWFFDQWVYHGGHPEFDVAWRWDDQSKTARVTIKQTQTQDELTPLFRASVDIELATPDETIIRKVTVSKEEETFHFDLNQRPTRVCFDPKDWLLKTLSFDKGKDELLDQLNRDEHLMCRVRAVQGLAKLAKDEDARSALWRAAQSDVSWPVRMEAAKALSKFDGPMNRTTLINIAQSDSKSDVREAAVKSLASFSHKDTTAAVRKVIDEDRSYYVAAEGLKTLSKVARKDARETLLAALERDSHRDVVLKAAVDGLVKLKDDQAAQRLSKMLNEVIPPQRRVAVLSALTRLKPNDNETRQRLYDQLDSVRYRVRSAAIDALEELGGAEAIDVMLAHRAKEWSPKLVTKIDETVEEMREKQTDVGKLQKELEALRKQNRQLEQRLEKLEAE